MRMPTVEASWSIQNPASETSVAKLGRQTLSAECTGGIINTRHVGQVSRLYRGLCETVGHLMGADQCRWVLGQCLDQPFGDAAPGPVFPRRWWGQNLNRRRIALGQIDTQALQARGRCLRARIVDVDVSNKGRHLTRLP